MGLVVVQLEESHALICIMIMTYFYISSDILSFNTQTLVA